MRGLRRVSRVALILLPLVQPETANATDSKFYSGMECVARIGSLQGDVTYTSGKAENIAAFPRTVTCPVVRDTTVTNPNMDTFEVWVDGNIGSTLTCTAFARNRSSTVQNSVTDNTNLDGFRVLNFGGSPPQTTGDGSVNVECTLPAASGSDKAAVSGYWVREF